jgi:hypothetical protein
MCTSEMLVYLQHTTWHYITEDKVIHNHRCESLRSFTVCVLAWSLMAVVCSESWDFISERFT